MNILNELLFWQYKLHHRFSKFFIDLKRDFHSEAKLGQIIAIVTTRSVSCLYLACFVVSTYVILISVY